MFILGDGRGGPCVEGSFRNGDRCFRCTTVKPSFLSNGHT